MTESYEVESGPAFPEQPDTEIGISATFIESGSQLQNIFIGLEPVLLIQPEYDADENKVEFVITSVDLGPEGLVSVLEYLLEGAREIASQAGELEEEMREADEALRAADAEFSESIED